MVKLHLKNMLSGRSRMEKVFFWSAVALVLYSLCGFFLLPALVKYTLVNKIPVTLNRPVAIDKIRINPYTLTFHVEGFELGKRQGQGHFVAFDELVVNLQAASLFKRAIIVKNLSLSHPQIAVSRHLDTTYNFSDLLGGGEQAKAEDGEAARPLLFSINNIEIGGGEVSFDDRPKGSQHQIAALRMAIPAISNLPYHLETYVQPSFAALINGTQMDLGGQVKPFADSQETSVDLQMAGIDIPSYLAYIPNETGLILKSALVDLDVKISYVKFNAKGARLALTGTVVVRQVEVVDGEQRSYLRLPRFTLEFGDANLLEKKIHLKQVSFQGLALEAWRLKNGDIMPLALLGTAGQGQQAAVAPVPEDEGPGLLVDIDLFEVTGGSARFHDSGTGATQPAVQQLEALDLRLVNFSTAPDNRAEFGLALQLNGAGEIKSQGQIGARPLFSRLDFDLTNIALKPYQAYVQQQLNVAIADGIAAGSGSLSVHQQQELLAVAFQGRAQFDKLALVDTRNGDDLLAWQILAIEGIDFTTQPPALSIDSLGLQGLAAKLIIFEDGSSNVSALPVTAGKEDAAGLSVEEEKAAAQSAAVAINKVTVEHGKVEFVDRKVRPSYGAVLGDLHGTIVGLSSSKDSQALVNLSGKVNRQAPLVISGQINPLQQEPFVDLGVDFRDLDLSHASPYTGTYVGYKTEKGKLNLDLHYLVKGQELTGENNIFLDQFTLGETVDSPDDLNLPISLAIALLKNRQGEINLDIPVAGNLGDPEFSIGGVVFQVLVNLIAKAATSPFALLGSLVPAGEDLQTVAFEAGRARLTPEARAKLDKIAYVLFERPGLRMDIMGQVDEGPDRQALARQLLLKMIKLQKLQEAKLPQGDKAVEESVQLTPQEYERYLTKIFELRLRAFGAPPSPVPQTLAEKEDYLVGTLKVADDQLRLLAIDRANQALQYLAGQGGIAPERLFVIEPQALAAEESGPGAAAIRRMIK